MLQYTFYESDALFKGSAMLIGKAKKLREIALDKADDHLEKAVKTLEDILRAQIASRAVKVGANSEIFVLPKDATVSALNSILGPEWPFGKFDTPMLDDLLAAQYLLGFPFSTITVK